MKPLYTKIKFQSAKSRGELTLECLHCHRPFRRTKSDIQRALNPNAETTCDFCSTKCHGLHQETEIGVLCEQCGSPFKKRPCDIKKTKHNFCSQSCAAKYRNAHKTKGTRVSKLEQWIAEQLPILFPDLEFHFNRKDAIDGELDIYVPSLHLAFELNGIFHYEPIYGLKKFSSVCTNDHRKMLACAERGIELCVIDVSSVKYLKPTKAQRFLDIIVNLVRTRLSGDSPAPLPLPGQNLVEVP